MNRQDERAAAIIERRTRLLAERKAGAVTVAPTRAMIIARVGQNLLGFGMADIAAVIPFEGCARMPMQDPAVLGVIGRAGRFYSVIGMRRILAVSGAEDSAGAAPAHLLLLRDGTAHLALAVDRVLGRFDLPGTGASFDLDGQLGAVFSVGTLLARFGRPATGATA